MSVTIEIAYLIDYEEYKSELVKWLKSHWGKFYPERNDVEWGERLFPNRGKLPLTFIAIDKSAGKPRVVGMLTLKNDGMPGYSYPKESVWVSSLYVEQGSRNNGIATHLLKYAIREAERLNIGELLLFTRTSGEIYKKLGWQTIATPEHQVGKVLVMSKQLNLKDEYKFGKSRNILFNQNTISYPSVNENYIPNQSTSRYFQNPKL